jgi:hypothetical protein
MPHAKNTELLNGLIEQCTNEFFQSRNVGLRRSSASTCVIEHAAAIGFSSKEIRGVVGIGMETVTLQRVVAVQPLISDRIPMEDWLGEAANQLLGRFKNKLVSYGGSVSVALPMILRGMRMQFVSVGADGLWTQTFDSDSGPICVWLDARMSDDLVLTLSTDPDAHSAAEGDMMLF